MDNDKPFAFFSIKGFNAGISEKNTQSYTFDIADNMSADIDNITLSKMISDTDGCYGHSSNNPCICNATVTYKNGTEINEKLISKTKHIIEHFLLVFTAEKEITANKLNVKLESYTIPEKKEVCAFDGICIREEVQIFPLYGKESYKDVFEDEILTDESVSDDFGVMKSIYDVENIESRYLLQYEFLKHLTAELYGKSHGSQALVHQFVVDKYNPQTGSFYKIGMTKSLLDPNKDLDYLTFYRNVIGHPAITEAEKKAFAGIDMEQTLVGHSRRISRVILFAIREKIRLGGSIY